MLLTVRLAQLKRLTVVQQGLLGWPIPSLSPYPACDFPYRRQGVWPWWMLVLSAGVQTLARSLLTPFFDYVATQTVRKADGLSLWATPGNLNSTVGDLNIDITHKHCHPGGALLQA